jgi:DNA-binding beta-propeller fold protein YncE
MMLKGRKSLLLAGLLPIVQLLGGCRGDDVVFPAEYDSVVDAASADGNILGFYLINEGNMGSNKCSLDYLDYATGVYARNIYAERNPNVIKELGDVGNDMGIYGSRLYIVVNCSNKVEVLDSRTGIRIGQVDIPNCRYIRFHDGKAYVSSYVGTVSAGGDAPKGAVYQVDTLSLSITGKATVGYQPEEMEVVDGNLYVANSGGYMSPNYDNTISVIRLSDFRQTEQIPVAINLHRLKKDAYNKLWVNSRGNYGDIASKLLVLGKQNNRMAVTDTIDVACSNMALKGDSLYYYATEWSNSAAANTITYGIVDVRSKKVVSTNFITDGTESEIAVPYGIAVNPETGDILITDAKNYVSSGTLYCFDCNGRKKWSVKTGDIPSTICFLYK